MRRLFVARKRSPALVLFAFFAATLSATAWAQDGAANSFAKYREQLLNDPDPEGKGIAAHAILNNLKPENNEGIEFLRGLLREQGQSEETVSRIKAVLKAFSLARHYGAFEEMLLLVSDARTAVREKAVESLQAMREREKGGRLASEIVRVLSSPLSQEKTRRAAIEAAGALRLFEALEPMAALLDHPKIAENARKSLYELVRRRFLDRAAFGVWFEPRRDWTQEQFLLEALREFETRDVSVTLKWMKDNFSRHLEALSDPNPEIRRAAAEGLSAFRTDAQAGKALDPLCQQFRLEYDRSVREAILKTLGDLGNPTHRAVRDLLLAALDLPDSRQRRVAVRSLSAFSSDPLVLPALTNILRQWARNEREDRNEVEFREDLLQTLKSASEPEAVPSDLGELLGIFLLNDATDRVRMYAAFALGAHGTEASVDSLRKALLVEQEPDQKVRFAAAMALKQIGTRIRDVGKVLPALHAFLDDPAFTNRKQGIELLGEIRDGRSAEPLLRRLGGESDPVLRQSLFAALGNIGEPSVLEPLLKMEWREGDSRDGYFQTIEKLCGKDPRRSMRAAQEFSLRGETARSAALLEKAGSAEGLDPALALEIRRQIVPVYRAAVREVASRPNAPAGAGADMLSKAKGLLAELRQAEPDQPSWALGFAEVQVELGQREEAIATYRELIPKLEKWAGADTSLLRRGLDPLVNLLLEKKDLPGAIAVLARIVAASPAEQPPLEKLASIRVQAGQIREAMEDYEKLISITSREDAQAWWRAVAGLCALRIEHSHAGGTWNYLRELPEPGAVSAPLAAQLATLRKEALEWIEFVGPLPAPPIPYEPKSLPKSE